MLGRGCSFDFEGEERGGTDRAAIRSVLLDSTGSGLGPARHRSVVAA
ncbi:hypothetical protein CLV79_11450 [Limimaricola soesokkakensis]|uniref:Uncharacterized protein n=1 Tax=Limimaricola soesokkakensis TaxID=1343159 RepID=A0A1X6Z5M8_9RHOB|nr:hypothetical protein CLV79_11450 [Limimaricola soesokkakensis]SLN39491.1 hypothetical protein LOS8367_01594 [Limimaricola soesokkakensis]